MKTCLVTTMFSSCDISSSFVDAIQQKIDDDNHIVYISPNIGKLVYVPKGSFQRDSTSTNISVITKP